LSSGSQDASPHSNGFVNGIAALVAVPGSRSSNRVRVGPLTMESSRNG
jgi:hypothetical protein